MIVLDWCDEGKKHREIIEKMDEERRATYDFTTVGVLGKTYISSIKTERGNKTGVEEAI